MNNRERLHAIMNYNAPDRMPAVHFGFTPEIVQTWVSEGHLPKSILNLGEYSFERESIISEKLGFDFGWHANRIVTTELFPFFEEKLVELLDNGFEKHINCDGVYVLQKPGSGSIPAEIDHLLKDRISWETHYLPRLAYLEERFSEDELNYVRSEQAQGNPIGLHCGSLLGRIRDYLGIMGLSYLAMDDEELFDEILETIGDLCYQSVSRILKTGIKFDYAHFWEDMCYKNGPLVSPNMFCNYTGKYYQKITDLLHEYGISIISVDCDGLIDSYIPIWLNRGVNVMFPIEVGTWDANIKPWRKKYGKEIKGIGGMRKNLFSEDFHSIDNEILRLQSLTALGGYIPCPDHRIPENAKWENVKYYCEKIKQI
ncbi:MAG: uroporphyrinogen decarboxylase family protein [Oscillospiraceae bacterium]